MYSSDWSFSVDMDNSYPSCLTFGSNCYVGIGTNNPTAQLEVKGRVKDQTGFLMPVGSVISYAGTTIPQGWLLCDGSAIDRINYSDLFNAIGTSWGIGDGSATFNLPDLRGQFLRGVDTAYINPGSPLNDPDHSSRVASNTGGNVGNNVGSVQVDAFKAHNHNDVTDPANGRTFQGVYAHFSDGSTYYGSGSMAVANLDGGLPYVYNLSNSALANRGGNETRPKNAYVYYIIKY